MRMQAAAQGDFVRLIDPLGRVTNLEPKLAERLAGELTEAVKEIEKQRREEFVPGTVFRDQDGDYYIVAGEELDPDFDGEPLLWRMRTGSYGSLLYWEKSQDRKFKGVRTTSGRSLTIKSGGGA